MSNAQISSPASDAEPNEPGPDPVADAAGQTLERTGGDEADGAGQHGLLSRSSAPQGRRSLFRR